MKKDELTCDEKWQAVTSCDSRYDGTFLYGVKTTGIFCKPSCRSKTPIRDNVIYFSNALAAKETGFRPCKRCCPDQIVPESTAELTGKIQKILDAGYDKQVDLNKISRQFGVSTGYLCKVFKQQVGLTPTQYIVNKRITKAVELLEQKNGTILDIAFETGFKSVSNFYQCFKKQTGYTPKEYKKIRIVKDGE